MTNGARASAPHMVVGLCFILLGGVLVLDRLELIDANAALQFWPVGLVLLGGGMMIQALRGPVDGKRRTDFPAGAIFWLVVLGLFFSWTFERRGDADSAGRGANLFALMSDDNRPIQNEIFHGGSMTSVMGATRLDLRQARLAPGEDAVVDVFALMGGAEIFVPKEWRVEVQAKAVMGGINDLRFQPRAERPDRRGRRGGRGPNIDLPDPPDLPDVPDLPSLPNLPGSEASESTPPPSPELDQIEREDPLPGTGSDAPKLIIRGVVLMGGLDIKP